MRSKRENIKQYQMERKFCKTKDDDMQRNTRDETYERKSAADVW
jgi:hypothetical protein